ncbi:hypothetical protein B0H14DRAFT_1663654 [Mycena olivaceomarginata]|nr:hypothetical protein B0H14DRAFT_1663654 [Mycena olivaceomarginata]
MGRCRVRRPRPVSPSPRLPPLSLRRRLRWHSHTEGDGSMRGCVRSMACSRCRRVALCRTVCPPLVVLSHSLTSTQIQRLPLTALAGRRDGNARAGRDRSHFPARVGRWRAHRPRPVSPSLRLPPVSLRRRLRWHSHTEGSGSVCGCVRSMARSRRRRVAL